MRGEITQEIEMVGKARFGQHQPAVAANRKDAPALDRVMGVEMKHVG